MFFILLIIDDIVIEKTKILKPDLIIVIAYGIILPTRFLNIPKYGCINIHVSLLPRWRGAAPIEHALLGGDDKTGISIISISPKLRCRRYSNCRKVLYLIKIWTVMI